MMMRWYTKREKREDFSKEQWRQRCEYYNDPSPPLLVVRILQAMDATGIWHDIPEVIEDGAWPKDGI